MRYAIVGNSGSGKSTLAKALGAQLGVRPIDLDEVYWEPDQPGVARHLDEASAVLAATLNGQAQWVIEGCYETLIATVLHLSPTLIWLDPGCEVCIQHCRARPWEPHKYSSRAAQDRNLAMLIDWVADHYEREGEMSYAAHQALFDSYPGDKAHRRTV